MLYVTKYVHFNNEVFLELSNDENLLRKILLLTIGNFYERSIDHMNKYCINLNTNLFHLLFDLVFKLHKTS